MFKIESISNRVVKGASLVLVTSFVIVDAAGELVSGTKAYDTEAEAQAKIDSMGNLIEGLAYAQAAFPGMSPKAQVGKANGVAAYLDWVAAGRPVTTVEDAQASDEAGEDKVEGESVVDDWTAPAVDEEETF